MVDTKKTIIILIISTIRPIKDHQKIINQQPVTKESDLLLITGDDEMVQHISPINKSGPQEIFSLCRKED